MKMRIRNAAILPLVLAFAASLPAHGQQWEVTRTMHIGGEGGWDYVTVDGANHRLFVTRSTHTQVIDTGSGKVLGDIPGQIRSHGVALVPRLNRGFITDGGGSGQIIVFDLKTYAVLGHLATMPDSDGIIYDPGQNLILAVSGDEGKLMAFPPDIDPNGKNPPAIDLGGSPEFLAADGAGKAYVNLEDKDLVAEVDLHAGKVIARWPVAPGGHPVGMAIDKNTHRLFIGCRNPQKLVVMSAVDGKVLGSADIGVGVDATRVDGHQAFASCRDGKLIVAAEKAGQYEVEQTVNTPDGARTMGLDTAAHKLYLPTAEFEPASAGQRRPQMKPGSFMIVEVSRK
jgi:DNA-binding beta-propeller fold protein YncE